MLARCYQILRPTRYAHKISVFITFRVQPFRRSLVKHQCYTRILYVSLSINVCLLVFVIYFQVCSAEGKIIGLNPNFPGSTHDAAIWRASQIHWHLRRQYISGERNQWLLGKKSVYYVFHILSQPFLQPFLFFIKIWVIIHLYLQVTRDIPFSHGWWPHCWNHQHQLKKLIMSATPGPATLSKCVMGD